MSFALWNRLVKDLLTIKTFGNIRIFVIGHDGKVVRRV